MAKNVVYTPVSLDSISNINAPKEIDKPDYPDKGIAYAGYSKTLISGNQFQLNPQIQADLNFNWTFAAGDTATAVTRINQDTKDFYCTDIFINYKNNGAVVGISNLMYIRFASAGQVYFVGCEPTAAYWELSLHFDTPIKIPKGDRIYFTYDRARIAGEVICGNMYGWEE